MGSNVAVKIILGIIFLIIICVLIIIAFKKYYKYLIQEKRCKEQVLGVVTGYTLLSRGNSTSGVSPSIVEYEVKGNKYKTVGPEYNEYKVKTVHTSLSSGFDVDYIEEGSEKIIITQKIKSIINLKNPMLKIYPLGSQIMVNYDPEEPSLSYVLRYCDKKSSFWMTIICSIIIFIIGLLLMILI